jgi:biotin carboxylase
MFLQKKVIVIVEASITGKYFAPAFKGNGYECIHVDIAAKIPKKFESFNKVELSCFKKNIKNQSIEKIIAKLKEYDVKAVIAGSETGVNAADQIAAAFPVLKNDVATTFCRRDKYLMIEALREHDIPCAAQYKSDNVDDLVNFYKYSNFDKVVFKPTLASSSEGVTFCKNASEIRRAFAENFHKRNNEGQVNTEFVLQEFLNGDEYIVDSVSCEGNHFITGIWKRVGDNDNIIATNKYIDFVLRNDENFQVLENYTKFVLHAVGIKNGPAHSELKLTKDGPKLIEVGARLSGIDSFFAQSEAQGYSQLSVAVETYLQPQLFLNRIAVYKNLPQKAMRVVIFDPSFKKKICNKPDIESFMKLSTIKSVEFFLKPGDYIKQNKYIYDRPGYAVMVADDHELFEKDYLTFRELEQKFYEEITAKKRIVSPLSTSSKRRRLSY